MKLKDGLCEKFNNFQCHLPESWRGQFNSINLDCCFIPDNETIQAAECIWPLPSSGNGQDNCHTFKSFQNVNPCNVRVVIFGNDPYPSQSRATGCSFEQGDLSDWCDLARPRSISPSLLSIFCAAIATSPAQGNYLAACSIQGRRECLRQATCFGGITPASPSEIFRYWEQQGVLWLNRTQTFSKKEHQKYHQEFWEPFTKKVIRLLLDEAIHRPIIFVMWGDKAKELERIIENIMRDVNGIEESNVRMISAGHPSLPRYYFKCGNPLKQINAEIKSCSNGPCITWV